MRWMNVGGGQITRASGMAPVQSRRVLPARRWRQWESREWKALRIAQEGGASRFHKSPAAGLATSAARRFAYESVDRSDANSVRMAAIRSGPQVPRRPARRSIGRSC